jgi:Bacterial surface proteins containing Ig-like domains
MKKIINYISVLFLLSIGVAGCGEYDRTEVVPAIFVNHPSLEMIVGDEIQLTVNPADGASYSWTNENNETVTVSDKGLVKAVGEGTSRITVSKGDIFTVVPVVVAAKVDLISVELNKEIVEVSPNSNETVMVTALPLNANSVGRTDFTWWSDDRSIAVVTTTSAGDGRIVGMKKGMTKVHYQRGDFVRSVDVEVDISFPFKGPHIVTKDEPFEILCADFDRGGEGNAFHDTDTNNQGNNAYRANNGDSNSPGVDVQGDLGIGYTSVGEWLLYSLDVQDAGVYAFQLRCAVNAAGKCRVEVDGVDVTGAIDLPPSGGWSNWRWTPEDVTTAVQIPLTEGRRKVKFSIVQTGFNIMALRLSYVKPID